MVITSFTILMAVEWSDDDECLLLNSDQPRQLLLCESIFAQSLFTPAPNFLFPKLHSLPPADILSKQGQRAEK